MGCWGLLGVAGMMKLIVRQWISPENTLRSPASQLVVPQFDSVLSWFITTISRTYGRYIELVDGGYKLTYNRGVPHCINLYKKRDFLTFDYQRVHKSDGGTVLQVINNTMKK